MMPEKFVIYGNGKLAEELLVVMSTDRAAGSAQ